MGREPDVAPFGPARLDPLSEEIGLGHAPASKRLYTGGAEVLSAYAQAADSDETEALEELTVVRHGQRVFAEVVRDYLNRITRGSDEYAVAISLLGYTQSGTPRRE